MGRRKKSSQPPIKLVIGRSPEQKKGQDNANYAVLPQSASGEMITRGKRKASIVDTKKEKEKEQESDDDDLEIVQVYKPPPNRGPRFKTVNQTSSRTPLVMVCVDEELSVSQKQALRQAQTDYDSARQKINSIKRKSNCIEVVLDTYISPELITTEDVRRWTDDKQKGQRPASPDVMIVEGPTIVKNKTVTAAVPYPTPTSIVESSVSQSVQESSKPLPILIRSNSATQASSAGSRSQDAILVGSSGIPLVIPTHFVHKGSQPILLQANQAGCLQVLGSGTQNMPVLGRAMLPSSGKIVPPLAPKMSVGISNPNLPPPPPLQCMAKNGHKRQTDVKENTSQPPVKRPRGRKKIYESSPLGIEAESSKKSCVNWVPLDEYYYSKKEGDPVYREEKGEYRFKCFYCYKMLYNNLRTMIHIQGHIDSDKQQNLDLSDLTQCKYCYKQFDTPFEMQCHVEKIHQNRSNVLVCRICEKDHATQSDLKNHMHVHNACEMPYICQLCNFRSSVYDDVVDHFKKRHDSSRYLVCLYCLKVFEVRFAKASGWGMTQNYYQHLLKHQIKASKLKCSRCKLLFIGKQELQMHKTKDHLPNYRGTQSASSTRTVNASSEQVMICVPNNSKGKVKSLNAPASQKQLFVGYCNFSGLEPTDICMECKKPMVTPEHYKKYTECSMCRFATICNEAFAVHMYNFHVRGSEKKLKSRKETHLTKPLFCLCGYSSNKGNDIANHLVLCSKRTCYGQKTEVKWFEYDDEQEEFNPLEPYCEDDSMNGEGGTVEKDVPMLFGALGLVKKASPRSYSSNSSSKESSPFRESCPTQIVQELIEDILDRIFPAEAAAHQFIGNLLVNVTKEIDVLEKCKFRSVAVIRASNRKLAKVKQLKRKKLYCSVSRTEKYGSTSEFQGSANEKADDQNVSPYTGSDIKLEDSSVDSHSQMSRAVSTDNRNKESGDESSNVDWIAQATSTNDTSLNTDNEKSGATSGSHSIATKRDDKNDVENRNADEVVSSGHQSEGDTVMVESADEGELKVENQSSENHEISQREAAIKREKKSNMVNVCDQLESTVCKDEVSELVGNEEQLSVEKESRLVEDDASSFQDQEVELVEGDRPTFQDQEVGLVEGDRSSLQDQDVGLVEIDSSSLQIGRDESVDGDKSSLGSHQENLVNVHEPFDGDQKSSETQKGESVEGDSSSSGDMKHTSMVDEQLLLDSNQHKLESVEQELSERQKSELTTGGEQTSSESQKSKSLIDEQQLEDSENHDSIGVVKTDSLAVVCETQDSVPDLTPQDNISPSEDKTESKEKIRENKKFEDAVKELNKNLLKDGTACEGPSVMRDPATKIQLEKDDKGSRDHHSRSRSRYDSSDDSHHYHSDHSRSRDTSRHYDRDRDRDRSSDSYNRYGSRSHDRFHDRDRYSQRPGRYPDYHDNKDYQTDRGHYYRSDRRSHRRGHRDGRDDYHGKKGYY